MSSLFSLITLPLFDDDCQLIVGQSPAIPFTIKRIYYILKPVAGLARGQHAHHKTDQILFCLQGKVKMKLDDGVTQDECWLSEPEVGIRLRPMIWHEMTEMSEDTILMVLASELFDESDYIRDYASFKQLASEGL